MTVNTERIPEGTPVRDPGGAEVGHVESVVGAPGRVPIEVRVVLHRHVLDVAHAADETRLLRVPGDDVIPRDEGDLVLREPWRHYHGQPSPPIL